jgi:hypothetical protein
MARVVTVEDEAPATAIAPERTWTQAPLDIVWSGVDVCPGPDVTAFLELFEREVRAVLLNPSGPEANEMRRRAMDEDPELLPRILRLSTPSADCVPSRSRALQSPW